MRRKLLILLGITTSVIGLTPLAQAQSGTPSNSTNSDVTLSGDSLRSVENRNLSNDYQTFFNGISPTTGTDGDATTPGGNQAGGSFTINDQLQLVVGDTLNSSDPLNLFPRDGEPGDPQRVKLQVPLSE